MNFVFWLIVIVLLAGFWACLCYIFPIIGSKFFKLKDTVKSNIDAAEKEKKDA